MMGNYIPLPGYVYMYMHEYFLGFIIDEKAVLQREDYSFGEIFLREVYTRIYKYKTRREFG